MPVFIIRSGKQQGAKLTLPEKEVVFGRDESCAIRLATTEVSRQHCAINSTPDGIFVRDLGSQNQTFVNDVAITEETRLEPGDTLRIGPMLLEVAGQKEKTTADSPSTDVSDVAIDDVIADWLTGENIHSGDAEAVDGETTIIRTNTDAASERKHEPPPAAKKQFKSVAEEGADIIRRHLEMVSNRKKSPDGPAD